MLPHPETGESDVTIHRMCFQSKDEISIFLQPGARHIGYFRELAEAKGNDFRYQLVSVWIQLSKSLPVLKHLQHH